MKTRYFKNYLRYSNRERKSFFYLLTLLGILAGFYLYVHFRKDPAVYIIESLEIKKRDSTSDHSINTTPWITSYRFHRFDPNKADYTALIQMGIPQKIARTWSNYLEKGGKFRNADALKKIYGMEAGLFNALIPYLDFENHLQQKELIPTAAPAIAKQEIPNFDPNTASKDLFLQTGLSSHLTGIILKFRAKGARFNRAEDLLKVFGMNDSILNLLRPYLEFPQINEPVANTRQFIVDINQSDTILLKQLPGIGSVLANRIVRFRESLGGFISTNQLLEVYGLRDSTLQKIQPYIDLSMNIRRIRINQDLPLSKSHPYLSIKDSQIIANYIRQNGPIAAPEQLKQLLAFEQNFWDKIIPYLSFEMSPAN